MVTPRIQESSTKAGSSGNPSEKYTPGSKGLYKSDGFGLMHKALQETNKRVPKVRHRNLYEYKVSLL